MWNGQEKQTLNAQYLNKLQEQPTPEQNHTNLIFCLGTGKVTQVKEVAAHLLSQG